MMPAVELTTATFTRLQKHAEPFVDTPDTIVNRALDALEKNLSPATALDALTQFDPASPPNLTHTRPKSIELEHKKFPPELTYWNNLLTHLVRRAAEKGKTPEEIKKLVAVNAVVGEKTVNGYKHIAEAGISVQGQDAEGAWKAIYSLADGLGLPLQVEFFWYDKPEAAQPGGKGRFAVNV
ncbi:MAG: T4SS efffector SepA family protein [Brevundimonas sp.]|uniref:T4SS efffector SepA family protein n=1 Tax=Brevundimonas sp. TaxID=1871086 RepID=UPI00391C24BF